MGFLRLTFLYICICLLCMKKNICTFVVGMAQFVLSAFGLL